jgi:hypothetical protein
MSFDIAKAYQRKRLGRTVNEDAAFHTRAPLLFRITRLALNHTEIMRVKIIHYLKERNSRKLNSNTS